MLMILTFVAVCLSATTLLLILRYVRRTAQKQVVEANLRAALSLQEQERQGREYLGSLLQTDISKYPPFGGWSASADFLIIIAEHILTHKPRVVVEFGSGASTLVALRCLELNGVGVLKTFDHDKIFAEVTTARARRLNLRPDIVITSLLPTTGYQGEWYAATKVADIDLLIVDGPPSRIHPETRGGAGSWFENLNSAGIVLLDDASRDGERAIVAQWQREHPDMRFSYVDTTKGTVIVTQGDRISNLVPQAGNS